MQVYRVHGRDLDEALRRARDVHGENAFVLGQENEPDGGVTVAVTLGEKPAAAKKRTRRRGIVERVLPAQATTTETPRTDTEEVRGRLLATGVSQAFVESVCAEVAKVGGRHPIDVAAEVIGRRLLVARSPRVAGATRVITFVGPTGVGKTLSLAKLGLQLKRAGRKVAFAATDGHRVGAIEEIQAYADLIEVPMHVVDRGTQLNERTLAASKVDAVLFDVPGCSPTDAAALEELRVTLSRTGSEVTLDRYLVLAATANASALSLADRAFASVAPTGCVITKLDETREPGAVLELVLRKKLPVAFLCDGVDVAKHLHRASADRFSDLMLRGRLS